ncbi:MAG: nitroreductase family protein [Planctomycetes bacterium]|nr:nitroreductase family protein [Planctomycetota bacterium]
MDAPELVPHADRYVPDRPAVQVLAELHDVLRRRRSVREFSDRPVPRAVIEGLIRCATTAPSGANKQPWRFVVVGDPELKRRIRQAAEAEERTFYERRANDAWLADLAPLGTDADKPFLEIAPWLVVVFALYQDDDGGQVYYVKESVGLAAGMFLAAAQLAGLATLTHTPSPMGFLRELLGRPATEKPFLLVPVGYPADDCRVPAVASRRKPLEQVVVWDPQAR